MTYVCTALKQPPAVVYRMAWADVAELFQGWGETPPEHVSLHCLAIGMGTMRPPGSHSVPADEAAMDRLLGD